MACKHTEIVLTQVFAIGFAPLHNHIYTSFWSHLEGGGGSAGAVLSAVNTYNASYPSVASYAYASNIDYVNDWKGALTGQGLAARGVAHHGGKWESSASLTEEIVLSLSRY